MQQLHSSYYVLSILLSPELYQVLYIYINLFNADYSLMEERAMAPHSSTLAWKIPGQRSLVGYSPWDRYKLDTTERLHFHFSLSCIAEENGNPLQCSCLENPRDGGTWWAAVYGVAQSRTRLKRLSSSSSSIVLRRKYCHDPFFTSKEPEAQRG